MYAAGAGAKISAVLFFVFIMRSSFCNSILLFIYAGISACAGNSGQQQQVNTEYEKDRFHKAKIMV